MPPPKPVARKIIAIPTIAGTFREGDTIAIPSVRQSAKEHTADPAGAATRPPVSVVSSRPPVRRSKPRDWGEAEASLRRALEIARGMGFADEQIRGFTALANLEISRNPVRAEARLQEALEIADPRRSRRQSSSAGLDQAKIWTKVDATNVQLTGDRRER
jgi:hypothetical protein